MRKFTTTGPCIPSKHYMVDITERLVRIRQMIGDGDYFCINRARQYGKTTTLTALRGFLSDAYVVVSLDFQGITTYDFQRESTFASALSAVVLKRCEQTRVAIPNTVKDTLEAIDRSRGNDNLGLSAVFNAFADWCVLSDMPLVLLIDEVDSASNNQVFLDFLSKLREGYIARNTLDAPFFQSVILAGVTDVRHLRSKIRPEDQHRLNSPWNIAVDFNVDMSLQTAGIATMLRHYSADHAIQMGETSIAQAIYDWTSGYPFLVSRICQLMDERVTQGSIPPSQVWSQEGLDQAIRTLLSERNTLFDSLSGKLENYPELRDTLRGVLMEGNQMSYDTMRDDIAQLEMYGFICRTENNRVAIANRVFEMLVYNYFLSQEEQNRFSREGGLVYSTFVEGGRLNMRMVLEGFRRTYEEIFGPLVDRFPEKDGRELFLLYLRPIINGTGNYYIEAQTRDQTRTDVIVDYAGERFVVELKIWRGPRYNEAGERQVANYLDYYGLDVGYMLSFNFNKTKEPGLRRVHVGDKMLYEETV